MQLEITDVEKDYFSYDVEHTSYIVLGIKGCDDIEVGLAAVHYYYTANYAYFIIINSDGNVQIK